MPEQPPPSPTPSDQPSWARWPLRIMAAFLLAMAVSLHLKMAQSGAMPAGFGWWTATVVAFAASMAVQSTHAARGWKIGLSGLALVLAGVALLFGFSDPS